MGRPLCDDELQKMIVGTVKFCFALLDFSFIYGHTSSIKRFFPTN